MTCPWPDVYPARPGPMRAGPSRSFRLTEAIELNHQIPDAGQPVKLQIPVNADHTDRRLCDLVRQRYEESIGFRWRRWVRFRLSYES